MYGGLLEIFFMFCILAMNKFPTDDHLAVENGGD